MHIEGYEALFEAAFPKSSPAITYDNVGNAIGAYERLFVTPALRTQKEKRGLKTFVTTGCVTCHTSNLLGGNMYPILRGGSPAGEMAISSRFDAEAVAVMAKHDVV